MNTKKISFFSLVLLIVAAIDSIRNLPAAALFGSSLIFFFVFSAIVFLIPTSFVAAQFTSSFHGKAKGGVYQWVNAAFGEKWALFAIWLQWINTMVWYPTILSFIAGTAAYLVLPELAQNKTYLAIFNLVVFWFLTLINLRGLHFSARINSFCVILGTLLPMAFLICLGIYWFFSGQPIHIDFSAGQILPTPSHATNWISLIAIMASFLGMELAGVHVGDIENPSKNFPKAVLYAVLIIIVTELLGSLTIASVLPNSEIRLVDGIMQVFTSFFHAFHLEWLIPVLTILIVVGSTGGMTNWLLAPAKGLLHAAEFGYLPPFFCKLNRHGVAARLLLSQAILVSVFCIAIAFLPTINSYYWLLTDLSTELYMIMYIVMFFAALQYHKKNQNFMLPGGIWGLRTLCCLGLLGCLLTIIVGFFPPTEISIGTPLRYAMLILFGNLIMIAPVFLFLYYKKKRHA
ncbi:MAG TPA: APC family permease [Chlamydiales bacterium]|nr:APC family permease [Chlamydiales bacterium]